MFGYWHNITSIKLAQKRKKSIRIPKKTLTIAEKRVNFFMFISFWRHFPRRRTV